MSAWSRRAWLKWSTGASALAVFARLFEPGKLADQADSVERRATAGHRTGQFGYVRGGRAIGRRGCPARSDDDPRRKTVARSSTPLRTMGVGSGGGQDRQ